jgi:hypothetical protein
MNPMIYSRPDIAYVVGKLSRYMANPSERHMTAAKHVLRYLSGTRSSGIVYSRQTQTSKVTDHHQLTGYSDADWAGDKETRKSTSGYVFLINGGPVSWASKRQSSVALRSCEAEYYALTQAGKEAVWINQLVTEVTREDQDPLSIYCDNQAALASTENPKLHGRMKHVEIQHHFIRELVKDKKIIVKWVDTKNMVADGLTKVLDRTKFGRFVNLLGVRNLIVSGLDADMNRAA